MIKKIHIENFRSLEKASLELGKITILTGANNSGKSSFLYAYSVLRDFVYNPNQSQEQLFALPFINLGGLKQVLPHRLRDQPDALLKIGIETADKQFYQLALQEGQTVVNAWSEGEYKYRSSMSLGLPYTGASTQTVEITDPSGGVHRLIWNGIGGIPSATFEYFKNPISQLYNSDIVPIKRGFSKPYYSRVPFSDYKASEEEIASLIATDDFERANVLGTMNTFFEALSGKRLVIENNGIPGVFGLMVEDKASGQKSYLVNEGTGINQLVTVLAKILQYQHTFTGIDEPEIHLHPGMIRKLAACFTDIVTEFDNKQLLISTHSEHLVQGLLAEVAAGNLAAEDLKVYFLERDEQGITRIEHQQVSPSGQLEGGLAHFYAVELENLKDLFKITD